MRPEHNFDQDRDSWERTVFLNADYFVVFSAPKHSRQEHKSFVSAIHVASTNERCMVYAVTESGRFVMIPRDKWPSCLIAWTNKMIRIAVSAVYNRHKEGRKITKRSTFRIGKQALLDFGCEGSEASIVADTIWASIVKPGLEL